MAAGSRGANIHIIGGISSLGWMTYDVKRGSIKKPDAIEWMKFCLSAAMLKHGGPVALIIDNAPCHSRVEQSILEDERYKDCVLLRLSPYSPMFNPIEHVWSYMKSHVKRELCVKLTEILSSAPSHLSMTEHRLRALEGLINEAALKVTPMLCVKCIASIQSKVAGALNLEDMTF